MDLPAGDDGYVQPSLRKLFGVEDESCSSHCPTRFGCGLGICAQVLHRLADFIFCDGDDVVHVLANVLEVDRANALRAQSVRQGTCGTLAADGLNLAGAQAGLGIAMTPL